MTAKTLLVVVGYAEMVLAGLLGAGTLVRGPLVLEPLSRVVALSSRGVVGGADEGAWVAQAKLIELALYAALFGLGLLLLVSAACAKPEPATVAVLLAEPRRRGPYAAGLARPMSFPFAAGSPASRVRSAGRTRRLNGAR